MSFCTSHEVQAPGKCRFSFHKLLEVLGTIRVPYKRFEALPALTDSNPKPAELVEWRPGTGLFCGHVLGISVVLLGERVGVPLTHGPGISAEVHL